MSHSKPSLVRVIQVDYTSLLSVLFPAASWGVYLILLFFQPQDAAGFFYIALATTVIGPIVLAWRYQFIQSVFRDGTEVPGVISDIRFFRGRGRVTYIYTYLDRKYASGNAINQTRRTKVLKQGDPVTVVMDPHAPKRALLRDLYID